MSARDDTLNPSDHVRVCDCPRPHPAEVMRCPDCRCRMADRPVVTFGEYQAGQEAARVAAEHAVEAAEEAAAPDAGAATPSAGEEVVVACPSCGEELPEWETLCLRCGSLLPTEPHGEEREESSPDQTYAPGVEVRDYRLEEQIAEGLAGESRLWTARNPEGMRVVVKAYDSEDPKRRDALARLRRIDDPAVVRVLETFVANGADHEIQEYLPHGTLRDWIEAHPGPVPPTIVRRVLEEASRSLAVIHAEELIHRDIKPSNFLVRTQAPLSLALADFGLSRRGHTGPHISQAIGRITHHYAAPEAFRQIADPKSDWWSVGIILYELLAGEHPLANLDATMVNAFHGYHWIEVDDEVPSEWKPLIEGLLTPPVQDRWGGEEVARWLAGDRSVPVLRRRPRAGEGYDFRGRKAHEPAALADLLATDWVRAEAHLSEGLITRWCEEEVRNEELTLSIRQLVADDRIPDEHWRLAVARVVLDPEQPLAFPVVLVSQGEAGQTAEPVDADALRNSTLHEVDPAWCRRFYREAIRIGSSSIPRWLADHDQPALQNWWTPREALLRRLGADGVETRSDRLQRLVTREPEEVVALGEELREQYVESSDPELQVLLEAPALDPYGAIRLLVAPGGAFRTADEVRRRDRLAEMTQSGVEFDREQAAELLHEDDEAILRSGRSYQREIVRSYDEDLDRIRRQRDLSVIDAALLSTASPNLYLTRAQRRRRRWARSKAAVPHLFGIAAFFALLWLFQEWPFLRHREPWLGLITPVLLAVIATALLLRVLGGVWQWLARDAAGWRRREALARGRSVVVRARPRAEASVYVLAVAVILGGWYFWDDARRLQYEWDMETAAAAVASGRAAEALSTLEVLSARYPKRADAHLELADALLRTGQLDRADDVLARAALLAPYRSRLHDLMGELFERRGWSPAAELAFQRAGYLSREGAAGSAADASLESLVATVIPAADALWMAQDSALVDAMIIFDSDDDIEPTSEATSRWKSYRNARIQARLDALTRVIPPLPVADEQFSTERRAVLALRALTSTWPIFGSTIRCSMGEPECGAGQLATIRLVSATRGGRFPHEAYRGIRSEVRDAAREQGVAWPYPDSLTSRYDGRLASRYLPRPAESRSNTPPTGGGARPNTRGSTAASVAGAAVDSVEAVLEGLPGLRDAGRYTAAIEAIDSGIRTLRQTGQTTGRVAEYTMILKDLRAEVLSACRAEAAVLPGRTRCPR